MGIAAAGPAWAHFGSATEDAPLRPALQMRQVAAGSLSVPAAVADPQAVVWSLLAVLLVTIVAMSRRRRVLVTSGLVALLVVFAFEEAVHSVHHGLGSAEAKGCAVAAASAHVTGTTVGSVTATDLVPPPAEEQRLESNLARPYVSYRSPVQERAPPA